MPSIKYPHFIYTANLLLPVREDNKSPETHVTVPLKVLLEHIYLHNLQILTGGSRAYFHT